MSSRVVAVGIRRVQVSNWLAEEVRINSSMSEPANLMPSRSSKVSARPSTRPSSRPRASPSARSGSAVVTAPGYGRPQVRVGVWRRRATEVGGSGVNRGGLAPPGHGRPAGARQPRTPDAAGPRTTAGLTPGLRNLRRWMDSRPVSGSGTRPTRDRTRAPTGQVKATMPRDASPRTADGSRSRGSPPEEISPGCSPLGSPSRRRCSPGSRPPGEPASRRSPNCRMWSAARSRPAVARHRRGCRRG